MGLGPAADVPLAQAREATQVAHGLLRNGINRSKSADRRAAAHPRVPIVTAQTVASERGVGGRIPAKSKPGPLDLR
jgi:hypothetical protein